MNKVSFISGHFNLIHLGHLRLFMHAKKISEKLVVGLLDDKLVKSKLYNDVKTRYNELNKISFIDKVVIINNSIEDTLNIIKPNLVMKGFEHSQKYNIETRIIKKWSGQLIFSSGDVDKNIFSKNQEKFSLSDTAVKEIKEFSDRHQIKLNELKSLNKIQSNIKGLVIGDIIIDEYKYTEAIGMSREDASIAVKPFKSDLYLGGAGVITNHLNNLGLDVELISILGKDTVGKKAQSLIKKNKLKNKLIIDNSRQSTIKTRIKEGDKTLLRINNYDQTPISIEIHQRIINEVKKLAAKKLDFIIFSDFNYGCITNFLVKDILKICKKNNITTLGDSQSSSQIGDLSKFKNIDFIFPTEYELRLMLNNQIDGLVSLLNILRKKNNVKNIILKLGKNGVLAYFSNNKTQKEDILASFNLEPKEVSGAGDAFLSTFTLYYALTKNKWIAILMGNIGASIKLSKKGNQTVKAKDIKDLMDKI